MATPALATNGNSEPESSGSIVVGKVLIYYAVLPAGLIRAFPPNSPER